MLMGIPTEQVLGMRQQGLSNNQIIDSLQRGGFTHEEVLEGMHQADLRQQINPQALGEQVEPQNPMPNPGMMPQEAPMQDMGMPPEGYGVNREQIEEIAEAIIDEKWSALIENVNRIIEWKDKTEGRIAQIEARLQDLQNNFTSLQGAVLEKVGEYDKHIQDVDPPEYPSHNLGRVDRCICSAEQFGYTLARECPEPMTRMQYDHRSFVEEKCDRYGE